MAAHPTGLTPAGDSKTYLQRTLKEIEELGIPVALGLHEWAGEEESQYSELWQLLESSRWPVRQAFVVAMLEEPDRAQVLFEQWSDLFPAVVGQDVKLKRRSQLMEMFDGYRSSADSPSEVRHAAILWMALIFFSDPHTFASWREVIRDAVFQESNPPHDFGGDVWMRLADCLLTFEEEKNRGYYCRGFARETDLLTRATRERVRGMAIHHAAIVAEYDDLLASGSVVAALALWLDAARLAEAHPKAPGAEQLENWCVEQLLEWVAADQPGDILEEYCEFVGGTERRFYRELPQVVLPASPSVREQLAKHALRWTALGVTRSNEYGLRISAILWPMLSADQQEGLVCTIAPIWGDSTGYFQVKSDGVKRSMLDVQRVIWASRCSMHFTGADHELNRPLLDEAWQDCWPPQFCLPSLLAMDAWSTHPALNQQQWLISAWAISEGRGVPQFRMEGTQEASDSWWCKPHLVPKVEEAVVRDLVDKLTALYLPSANPMGSSHFFVGKSFDERSEELLGRPVPRWLKHKMYKVRGLIRVRYPNQADEHQVRAELILGFVASGLLDPEVMLACEAGTRESDDHQDKMQAIGRAHPAWWAESMKGHVLNPQSWQQFLENSNEALQASFVDVVNVVPLEVWELNRLWDWMLMRATNPSKEEAAVRAFTLLFRLEARIDEARRAKMREEFLAFYGHRRPPLNVWSASKLSSPYNYLVGYGEAVAWADDALAAQWAWSSQIKMETHRYPYRNSNGVFAYLAQACKYISDDPWSGTHYDEVQDGRPVEIRYWRMPPLHPPFEKTAWQKARELHLRRPDLKFPDYFPLRLKYSQE